MKKIVIDEDISAYIPHVKFELIPIKNLVSNQDYQRNVSNKHIQRTAMNFDLRQINPVKVSRRNGINYVFNGQHTIEIIALVSNSRETPVWCMVYEDLEYQQEADIFANQMKYTKPLAAYEIFLANIEAGNDKQLIIKNLVEDFGLTISYKPQDGCICAIATLEKIFDKYGSANLQRTIALILGTWEGVPQSFSANMLNGISRLIDCYGDELKNEIFKEKLSRVSVKTLSRTAKDRRNGSLGYAEAIIIIYNTKNQRNSLQFGKLYSKSKLRNTNVLTNLSHPASCDGSNFDYNTDNEDQDSQYSFWNSSSSK